MQDKTYIHKGIFELENKEELIDIRIKYSYAGKINSNHNNIIWVCHALTGNTNVFEWWSELFGHGKIFCPSKYFIICVNSLGSCYGTTGPNSLNPKTKEKYYNSFPFFTIRDMVGVNEKLRIHLGINNINILIGASLGGMLALEWSYKLKERLNKLIAIATNAVQSAWAIAFNESQRLVIENSSDWNEATDKAGIAGLKIARSIAMLSYRSYNGYNLKQKENDNSKINNFKASSYQIYQGEKLSRRFSPHSYYYLSKAMDSHNMGRGRDNIEKALSQIKARSLCIGIDSDLIFPNSEQKQLSKHIKNAKYKEIKSMYGHDAFLIEHEQLNVIMQDFINNNYE
ncbi:MAG: homoserine O-acetyltransferase [Marinifilaceae bacterium]|jgi:homoserine O-acetyltransferase|nr:homoserine O-acetyltransferase [Marinifilaceae bacterium]